MFLLNIVAGYELHSNPYMRDKGLVVVLVVSWELA